MSGSLLLGVDIGTSSAKGVLCTPEGGILASAVVEHETSFPGPGRAEHDADVIWWGEFVAICRQLLSGRFTGADIGGVAISAIGPCMLPVDRAGRPLRPAILYGIDSRASAEIAWLEEHFGQQAMFDLGGMALSSQTIGPKILWFRRHEPELFAQTAIIHSASDYVVFRLTEEHVIDRHSASYFSPLFDWRRLEWDARFAEPIIEQDRLPRLLDANEIAGQVTRQASAESGLAIGTPVTAGTIDAAAEAISAGVADPGDTMIMYGSTLFLLNLVAQPRPDRRMWTTAYSLPQRRAVAGGMATSGLITRWFRDVAGDAERRTEGETGENAYQQLARQAAAVPAGCDGLICLPYFAGERTPLHDPEARGVFAGLTLRHTRGHLYRAVLEGVGYGVRHNLDVMREMHATPKRVVAVGGGTQSHLWPQIVSDIAAIPQLLPERTIGAAYGDAFLAGLATGLIEGVGRLGEQWVRIRQRIEPDAALSRHYDAHYQIYRNLYDHAKDDLHQLGRLTLRPV